MRGTLTRATDADGPRRARLLGGGAALTQSDGWFNRWTPEPQSGQEEPVLPWQQGKEHWLVVVVDFDDATTQSTGLGVEEASTLVEGDITDYLSLMAGDGSVNFTVVPVAVRANSPSTHYGVDSAAGRDFAADGTFMPSLLVAEVISTIEDDVDWHAHDLDDDGTVDRLLVLHTSRGQESGAGGSDRIWSHFTHLMEPVSVASDLEVAHYAMATLRGGTGATGPSCMRCSISSVPSICILFMTRLGPARGKASAIGTSWRQETGTVRASGPPCQRPLPWNALASTPA